MKKLLLILIPVFALTSCLTTEAAADGPEMTPIAEQDLMETGIWTPGSTAGSTNEGLVEMEDGSIHIDYMQAKKEKPNQWPDIEVSVAFEPQEDGFEPRFYGMETITLTYKCSDELKIRLNQTDFMADGDNSFALYYWAVPASDEWKTVTVELSKFIQPSWAEASSKAIPMKLQNVTAIALSPQTSYATGGEATIDVQSMIIK